MGTVVKFHDHRIIIEPSFGYRQAHASRLSVLQDIVQQIARHVDVTRRDIGVEFSHRTYCEYCNYAWELDDEGNPVCCTLAQIEHDQKLVIMEGRNGP